MTVMKTPPVITPLVALSVPALLVLMEMESTVQVRLVIISWLKSDVLISTADPNTSVCYFVCEYSTILCFCCSGMAQLKPTIDSFNRYQWVWTGQGQLPYIFKLFWHNWQLWMYLQQWICRRWSQLHKYVWAENGILFSLHTNLVYMQWYGSTSTNSTYKISHVWLCECLYITLTMGLYCCMSNYSVPFRY